MSTKFELNSPYKPSGDQPQAIEKLIAGIRNGDKGQTLLGATGTGKTFVDANIIAAVNKSTLVLAHNKTLAAQLYNEFKAFFPNNAVHYFVSYYDYYQPEAYMPITDTYIEKDADINAEIDHLRHAATHALLTRSDVLVVASVSCIYGLGSPDLYKSQALLLSQNQIVKMAEIMRDLTAILYERNDYELLHGRFRVKGDILEIFPQYEEKPIRIEFFGDTIERIVSIDPVTGKTGREMKNIDIWPAKHFLAPPGNFNVILDEIRRDMEKEVAAFEKNNQLLEAERLRMRTEQDLEMLELTGTVSGIENYSRYFDGRQIGLPPKTLLDYFPKDYLLVIDESHMTVPQIGAMYFGDKSRKDQLVRYGFRLKAAFDNRPLKFSEFEARTGQIIYQSATPAEYELKHSARTVEQIIRPTGLLDPRVEIRPTENQIDNLLEEVKNSIANGHRVLITTLTKKIAEELAEYLYDLDIKVQYLHSDVDTLERSDILRDLRMGVYDVVVGINLLREGLDLPEVSLVIILDADKEGFLRSSTSLIQTIGRAARHIDGRVIMYADRVTKSMQFAIDETNRRRQIQEDYNIQNNIMPVSAVRKIEGKIQVELPENINTVAPINISKERLQYLLKEMESKMQFMSANLDFEKAAIYRDEIKRLKGEEVTYKRQFGRKRFR